MKKLFIIFILFFAAIFSGCNKTNLSEETTISQSEITTENLEENSTEKSTEIVTQQETLTQQSTEKKCFFAFEQGHITEIYVDGKLVVKNEYKNGLRAVKRGVDYCEFTYNSERDMVSEIRNGELITYLYKEQDNSIYLTLNGFNYEGKNYYYTKDNKGRIDGITNSEGELIAKYEYDTNGYKVENVLSKAGDKWVSNSGEKFIGNINRIRHMSSYFDIETGLYYQNAVFYDSTTGAVIQWDGGSFTAAQERDIFQYYKKWYDMGITEFSNIKDGAEGRLPKELFKPYLVDYNGQTAIKVEFMRDGPEDRKGVSISVILYENGEFVVREVWFQEI